MVLYEVALDIPPDLAPALERYMREQHIPEIWTCGCFSQIRFDRMSDTRFRTSYMADDQAALDGYLSDHAPHFRVDFMANFPSGVTVAREVWTSAQTWPADSARP